MVRIFKSRQFVVGACFFVLMVGVLAVLYGPRMGDYFLSDDFGFLYKAKVWDEWTDVGKYIYERSLFGSGLGLYRPLIDLSFLVDYTLWGLNPIGYHIHNLIIHLATGIFLWLAVNRLSRHKYVGIAAAGLFWLSPLHVESVIWLSGRTSLYSGLLVVAAWYFFIVYRQRREWLFFFLMSVSFVLAMAAKEVSVIFPLLALTTDVFMGTRRAGWQKGKWKWLSLVWLGALAGLMVWWRYRVLEGWGGYQSGTEMFTNFHGEYVWRYLAYPWVYFGHQFNPEVVFGQVGVYLVWGYGLICGLMFLIWLARRDRQWRVVGLAVSWLFLAGLPTYPFLIGDLNLYNYTRYLYLPSVGMVVLLAVLMRRMPRKVTQVGVFLSLVIFSGYGILKNSYPWMVAAEWSRKIVVGQKEIQAELKIKEPMFYWGVPETFAGAYVLRNGLDYATALMYDVKWEKLKLNLVGRSGKFGVSAAEALGEDGEHFEFVDGGELKIKEE